MKNIIPNYQKEALQKACNLAGMITVVFYVVMTARNLIQLVLNFDLLLANGSMFNVVLYVILYLFIIIIGFEAVRRNNLYLIIFTLVSVLIIY